MIPARPVRAADLPKRLSEQLLGGSDAGPRGGRARPAPTSPPGKARGSASRWRCRTCGETFGHYATAETHVTAFHRQGVIQWHAQ